MADKQIRVILNTWKDVKRDIHSFIKSGRVQKAQDSVKKYIESAQKDLNNLMKQDISTIKARLKKEQKEIEKTLDNVLRTEGEKLKKFLKDKKKNFSQIQQKLDTYAKRKKKTSKKVTSRVSKKSKKKVSKKASKKTSRKKAGGKTTS